MSDDRLFASNNAIGRKWYFLNLIILSFIIFATHYGFTEYIIPNVRSEVYEIIANGIMYFAYFIYAITYFALVDRRLYDASGARESKQYKNIAAILKFAVCFQIMVLIIKFCEIDVKIDAETLQGLAWILDGIFVLISFFIGFLKGKISNLSYEEYKNKLKFKL